MKTVDFRLRVRVTTEDDNMSVLEMLTPIMQSILQRGDVVSVKEHSWTILAAPIPVEKKRVGDEF